MGSRDYILAWMDALRARIRSAHGRVLAIGFSGVSSWSWFNYAAWSEACDGTEQPQCYFWPHVVDQAVSSARKSRGGA